MRQHQPVFTLYVGYPVDRVVDDAFVPHPLLGLKGVHLHNRTLSQPHHELRILFVLHHYQ